MISDMLKALNLYPKKWKSLLQYNSVLGNTGSYFLATQNCTHYVPLNSEWWKKNFGTYRLKLLKIKLVYNILKIFIWF